MKNRFDNKWIPEPFSSCWIWIGAITQKGYGQIRAFGRNQMAHRVSWMLHKGEIPKGLHVLHRCDTPGCVNPEHLFLGTPADNSADMVRKNRQISPNAILTKSDVVEIRNSHLSIRELAMKFGLEYTAMWKVVTGRRWKKVQPI